MRKVTIYHNPRCSKSRQTLQLLQDHNIEPQIIEYLQNPPSQQQLKQILSMLKMKPRDLIRKSETEYKTLKLDDTSLSDAQLLAAMVNYPKLIERPIVVNNGKAAIGRPPENILEIL